MTRLNVNDARCEALFASELQRSDAPTPEALATVISRTVRQFGVAGCASRMRWIRQLIGEAFAPAAWRPAGPGGWPPNSSSDPRTARPATGRAHQAA